MSKKTVRAPFGEPPVDNVRGAPEGEALDGNEETRIELMRSFSPLHHRVFHHQVRCSQSSCQIRQLASLPFNSIYRGPRIDIAARTSVRISRWWS